MQEKLPPSVFDLRISQTVRLHLFSFSSGVITSRSADNLSLSLSLSLVSSSELSLRAVRAFLLRSLRLLRPTRFIRALFPSNRAFPGGRPFLCLSSRPRPLWRWMCQSNLHFGGRPLLRSVIKRKSTNYNWQLNWRRDAAAANNTPKRTNGGRDSKESKQRHRFAVFLSFVFASAEAAAAATGKMDYVTLSHCCV